MDVICRYHLDILQNHQHFLFFSLCILPTKAYWVEEGDIESPCLMSVFLSMLSRYFYSRFIVHFGSTLLDV